LSASAVAPTEPPHAPAIAVEPEANEIASAQRQVAVEDALLWDVPDAVAVEHDAPARRLELSEQDPQERGLPRAVRPEHGEELASAELEAQVVPQLTRAEAEGQVLNADDAQRASARFSAVICRSCHCW
jgi:hypothetical protein